MATVQHFETHISDVVVDGEFAWKRKKAVRFDFLDFSTLALRAKFCREEVRVNRRLAPSIYLGVAPLHRGRDGRLALGPLDPLGAELAAPRATACVEASPWPGPPERDAPIVDWCVVMARLPAEGMLDAVVARGEFHRTLAETLAQKLVTFHRAVRVDGARARASGGAPSDLKRRHKSVLAEADAAADALDRQEITPSVLSPAIAAELARASSTFLRDHSDWFERRLATGAIVDGHGDLHCANLCVVDGDPIPFDAIEFNPEFRLGDVANDLAFLLMDLRRRGAFEGAATLAAAYVAASGDGELARLLPYYEAQRATIRGNVAALRAAQTSGAAQLAAANESRAAFALAATYGWTVPLIVMCGRPGSGKSRLARALAPRLGATVVAADVVRKELAGLPVDQPSPPQRRAELYEPAAIQRIYDVLLERAQALLAAGRPVVLDATYSTAARRAAAAAAAERLGVPFVVVHCRVDDATIERRLLLRVGEPGQASDADLAVERATRDTFEAPTELPARQLVDFAAVDGSLDDPRDAVLAGPLGQLVATLVERVVSDAGRGR